MNIIFFGSSEFGVSALKAILSAGHKVLCVVTRPDRKKGRHLRLEATPIKQLAERHHLNIYQPEDVNIPETINFLKGLDADLFVVISYGQMLSQDILCIPKILSINAHASILPKYRGAAPINWAVINGEASTGVSIIKMAAKMDAGPILMQETLNIREDDTCLTLEVRLSEISARLLVESICAIEKNKYTLAAQDESKATFAPKLKKENGLISWQKGAWQIFNLIRGTLDWPGAFTYYEGKILKVYKVVAIHSSGQHKAPGEIIEVSKKVITVATGEGDLAINELQLEGKRRMSVEEFIRGRKICAGEFFGKKSLH